MSLPKQFDHLRDTLRYGKTEITLDEVVGAIHSKQLEFGVSGKYGKTAGEGLFVNTRGRSKSRDGSFVSRRKDKSRSKSRPRRIVTCWFCDKEGHYKRDCPLKNKSKTQSYGFNQGETASVKVDQPQSDVLIVEHQPKTVAVQEPEGSSASSEDKGLNTIDFEEAWIMDTGCTFHMSSRKDWFENLKEEKGGTVRMANNAISNVEGIGDINLITSDGGSVKITNVRFVPDFSRNLISLGTLESQGCSFGSEKGVLKVRKGCRTILKGKRHDSLYLLQGKTQIGECSSVCHDETQLWHRRLGHMSHKGMEILTKKGYLDPKKVTELEFCEDCIYGKIHRVSFSTGTHTSKQVLDYVHADLWGSPNVPLSLGKCQYFLSIIGDFSRKVWVSFLRTKDKAFERFEEWVALVENITGRKVKKLRTDNGLEFCNHQFDSFCSRKGISRHKTVVYTPQQNGVAEQDDS